MDNCLYEILAGKSRLLPVRGEVFFYKHPTLFELEMSGEFEEKYRSRAEINGLLTEEKMLLAAKSNGGWSDEEEAETKELIWLAEKQEKALKKVADEPSLLQTFQNNLNHTRSRLEELHTKREALTRFSLENYIKEKVNSELIRRFVFEDEQLSIPVEHQMLPHINSAFMSKYNDLMDRNKTLIRCYNPSFFEMFLLSSDNPLDILGKNFYDMTIFQKNLLVHSYVLRRKIDNIPDIPKGVLDDPIKLYEFDPDKGKEVEVMGSIRKQVEARGGSENMKPEDYIT